MGSAKDIYVIAKPYNKKMGIGAFKFSDRYSVFDWGEMPDEIPNKGKALCMISAYMFEEAEKEGIPTHYRGLIHGKEMLTINEANDPLDVMEFDMVRVIKPSFAIRGYDYYAFKKEKCNFLIPLEIIYRNSLPEGSSVFKRLNKGEVTPESLGLDHYPKPGEKLSKTIFDVSTKLESKDRYVSWDEAREMSGMSEYEIDKTFNILNSVNNIITKLSKKAGMENEDGKIEIAFDSRRNIMMVDVFGTPDECRLTSNGINISKEMARQYYNGSQWAKDVESSKKEAVDRGIENWRDLCKTKPEKMDSELKEIISNVYTSIANEFLGKKIFDSPRAYEVVDQYKDWLDAIDLQ